MMINYNLNKAQVGQLSVIDADPNLVYWTRLLAQGNSFGEMVFSLSRTSLYRYFTRLYIVSYVYLQCRVFVFDFKPASASTIYSALFIVLNTAYNSIESNTLP